MLGLHPAGASPLGSLWIADLVGPADPVKAIVSTSVERIYLVDVNLYTYTLEDLIDTDSSELFVSTDFGDTLVVTDSSTATGTTLRYSTHGVDLINPYEARIKNAYNFSARMYDSNLLSGRSSNGFGDISILNGDGGVDNYLQMAWDNGTVDVMIGARGYSYTTVFSGKIESATWDTQAVSLRLRDRQTFLEQPLQETVYAGTGGTEGGDDLKGKPKPKCYGRAVNIQPPLVDASNLVYQVNDGAIESVDTVRFAGITATEGTDYTVNLSDGTITLLTAPGGVVTCDVQGDNGNGYIDSTGPIIRRILTEQAGFTDPDDLDTVSFAALLGTNSATVGYYTGTEVVTMSQVIDDLMTGIGGYWGIDRYDNFFVGVLDITKTPIREYDNSVILSIKRITTPLPSYKTTVGYKRLWYTMAADQLAGAVSDSDASFLQQTVRLSSSDDINIRTNHPLSYLREVRGYFYAKADADAESQRQQALFGTERNYYEVEIKGLNFDEDIGDVVTITYPRFGLDSGGDFIVTAVDENARTDRLLLTVWG